MIHIAGEMNTVTITMTFKAGINASNFKVLKDKLKEAITETLKQEFNFVASEVALELNVDQKVIVSFKVDDTEQLIEIMKGSFVQKLNTKMIADDGILKDVVLDSASAGTN